MSVEGVRHPPVLAALFGMKAEDSELLGTAELIKGTDDLQQNPGPDQRQPGPLVQLQLHVYLDLGRGDDTIQQI